MGSEDDDVPFGGPPPDPSIRQWRHPSEVAAASAAAARAATPQTRRWWSPLSFLVGGAAGAVVCLGVVLALTSSLTGDGSQRLQIRTGAEPVSVAVDPAPSTTTLLLTTVSSEQSVDTSIEAPDPTADARADIPLAVDSTGVVGLYDAGGSSLLANALVVDGMVLTSATAIGRHDRVRLLVEDDWLRGEVVGIDRFTDVAVVMVDSGADLTSVELPSTDDPLEPGDGVVLVANDGQPEAIKLIGEVLSVDERAVTSDGHNIIGAVLTDVRLPESASGAALVDTSGAVVGMVVDSDGYLATAIPLSTARYIGKALVEHGWPSQAWLGIEGTDTENGIQLTAVTVDGPADRAGLQADDLLATIDGAPVLEMADLVAHLRQRIDGQPLNVGVSRDGESWTVEITPGTKG